MTILPSPIPPKYYRLIQALLDFAERKRLEAQVETDQHEDSAPVVAMAEVIESK